MAPALRVLVCVGENGHLLGSFHLKHAMSCKSPVVSRVTHLIKNLLDAAHKTRTHQPHLRLGGRVIDSRLLQLVLVDVGLCWVLELIDQRVDGDGYGWIDSDRSNSYRSTYTLTNIQGPARKTRGNLGCGN